VKSATIAGLLRPYAALNASQVDQVSIYLDLLLKWNARINLTAVRDPEEMVTRHFGESFFAAERLLHSREPLTVIDLGSGAGFPGLPLAIFAPWAQVTLIESSGKKAAFLNEVIFALKLKNAKVFAQRAESYAGSAHLVMMRAVEKFVDILPIALHLVQPGGRIALMIGASQLEQARALAPEVQWQVPEALPGGHSRVLAVGTKSVIVDQ
jgi:16S rRNA (guanine527-N7)-methyltransferase